MKLIPKKIITNKLNNKINDSNNRILNLLILLFLTR